jgi:hypothetical protein
VRAGTFRSIVGGGNALWQGALIGGGVGAINGAATSLPRQTQLRRDMEAVLTTLALRLFPSLRRPHGGFVYFPAGLGIGWVRLTVRVEGEAFFTNAHFRHLLRRPEARRSLGARRGLALEPFGAFHGHRPSRSFVPESGPVFFLVLGSARFSATSARVIAWGARPECFGRAGFGHMVYQGRPRPWVGYLFMYSVGLRPGRGFSAWWPATA